MDFKKAYDWSARGSLEYMADIWIEDYRFRKDNCYTDIFANRIPDIAR